MQRISGETISQINSRVDIVSLVGEYVNLTKKGSDWWGCCPFHTEKTPSFHVVPDKNMCHCFGCGKGGGLISFYMEIEKIDFGSAVENLAKKYGIEIIYEGNSTAQIPKDTTKEQLLDLYKRVCAMFRYILTSRAEGQFAKKYIDERGLSEEISEQFMIGYAPANRRWLKKFLQGKNYSAEFLEKSGLFSKNYPDVSFFSDRLMFPICDKKGQVVAFGARLLRGEGPKYLNSGELPQYKKGEILYGFHLAKQTIRESKTVILCEGYMDVIAYHQAGIKNAVAPLGTALTAEQIRIFKPFAETVILSFDTDTAGISATKKAILLCREQMCTVKVIDAKRFFANSTLSIPKDPAEILHEYGKDVLTNIVNNAIIDCDFLLSLIVEHYNDSAEGKLQACLDFFPYINALQSDIQKDFCLEQLCKTFNLKLEAVKADYKNQGAAKKRLTASQPNVNEPTIQPIKKNAELRLMLASIVDMQFYPLIRSSLLASDFEDSYAQELYFILEECFREDSMSYDVIFAKCQDEQLKMLISNTVTSGEFLQNTYKTIEDGIQLIKRNSLVHRRNNVMYKIRQYTGIVDDQTGLKDLIEEKMMLDEELKIKDTNE